MSFIVSVTKRATEARRIGRAVHARSIRSCVVVAAVAAFTAAAGPPAGATPKLGAEAARLQGEFQRATTEERRALADAMLALGEDGARRLHGSARTEFLSKLQRYTTGFERAVADVLAGRSAKGDPSAEIAALRKTIQEVAATGELTKEMIAQKSDPAISRLEQLLVVTPADVYAATPDLVAARDELLWLAEQVERAAAAMPEKSRAKLPPFPGRDAVADELEASAVMTSLLSCPMSPGDRETLKANLDIARGIDPEEASGMQRLNQIRILGGLPALLIDPKLNAACRVHSQDMVKHGFFAHESPVAGRETPWSRAAAAGTSADAENIAAGMSRGEEAIESWWHSPGHHKNLLGDHQRTGLGCHERHWTQLFQ